MPSSADAPSRRSSTRTGISITRRAIGTSQAYPQVAIFASNALEGALATFLKKSREQSDAARRPEHPGFTTRSDPSGRDVIDHPERIRPNHLVERSGRLKIAGRMLDVHLANFAATEGDVWLYDPKTRVAIVGDLVVDIVPFMDTACAEGWLKALGEIERTPFKTLIPGHGAAINRDALHRMEARPSPTSSIADVPSGQGAVCRGLARMRRASSTANIAITPRKQSLITSTRGFVRRPKNSGDTASR